MFVDIVNECLTASCRTQAPSAAITGVPKQRELTEPVGFNLESVRRAEASRLKLLQLLRAKEDELARMRTDSFKVAPAPDFSRPFAPQPSSKELTTFKEFSLESSVRHERAVSRQRCAIKLITF
jgi:hypothetical protein